MECTSEYTNWDLRSAAEFTAWRLAQGPHSLACSKYPYCSHFGGAFYNPIPPWLRREEARHSDIPKGMARALEDGQITLYDERLYGSKLVHFPHGTPYLRRRGYWPYTREDRSFPSGWGTTQETLSFID